MSTHTDAKSSILELRDAQARYESRFAADCKLLWRVLAEAPGDPDLSALLARGIETFGSADSLLQWLLRPHVIFGRSPLATIADGDREAVEDELCRIDHGEFA